MSNHRNILISISCLLFFIIYSSPLFAQTGHWTQLYPSKSPPARYSFGMSSLGENKVLLFGGQDSTGKLLGDTWIYDLNMNSWTQINTPNHPSPRSEFALTCLNEKKVLLFGGSYAEDIYIHAIGDTWIFDIDSLNWYEMNPANSPSIRFQSAISNHSLNKAILYGGLDNHLNSQHDSWLYDLDSNQWILLPIFGFTSQRPEIQKIDDSLMIEFGGAESSANDVNKTYIYYPGLKNTWKELKINNPPPVMHGHSMGQIGKNKVILFGGTSINDLLNDTWIFNYSATTWKKIEVNVKPSKRYLHKIARIGEGRILLFSGYNNFPMDADTWIFSLDADDVEDKKNISDDFQISPNPAKDYIEISVGSRHALTNKDFRIFNVFGELVSTSVCSADTSASGGQRIDVSGLPSGIYFVRVGEKVSKFIKI